MSKPSMNFTSDDVLESIRAKASATAEGLGAKYEHLTKELSSSSGLIVSHIVSELEHVAVSFRFTEEGLDTLVRMIDNLDASVEYWVTRSVTWPIDESNAKQTHGDVATLDTNTVVLTFFDADVMISCLLKGWEESKALIYNGPDAVQMCAAHGDHEFLSEEQMEIVSSRMAQAGSFGEAFWVELSDMWNTRGSGLCVSSFTTHEGKATSIVQYTKGGLEKVQRMADLLKAMGLPEFESDERSVAFNGLSGDTLLPTKPNAFVFKSSDRDLLIHAMSQAIFNVNSNPNK